MLERFAVMHEYQLLLARVPPQQVHQRRLLAAGADRGEALCQRVPARIGMAVGQTPHRRCGRRRGRSCRAQKMLRGEPVYPFACQPTRRLRELLVGLPLACAPIHAHRHGVTARELQRDYGSRVAHHCAAHELAQALGIGRHVRLARRHMDGAKLLKRLEDAGLEQREYVVKFEEVVLHWRCRQQQQEALVERVHQLVASTVAIAQVVSLVHDNHIEAAADDAGGMLAASRECERSDQALLLPEPLQVAAYERVVGGGALDVKLGLELLPPLPDQRCRSQHQHAVNHAAQQILLEHHSGLDGLAEPDLVSEQHAAAKLLEDLAHGLHLVPEGFDAAQMRQAEQFVEALREAEMGEALAQAPPAAVGLRRRLRSGQQRREIDLGAERDIESMSGSGGSERGVDGGAAAPVSAWGRLSGAALLLALTGNLTLRATARLCRGALSRSKMRSYWCESQA